MTSVKKFFKRLFKRRKKVPEADLYIVSYPKSGRTWLRALVGRYLSSRYGIPEDRIFSTEEVSARSGLLTTSFAHDGSAMNDKTSWSALSYDRSRYRNKKVILLGRDLKDTLVSAYHQATQRAHVFDGSISDFIRSERFGIRKLLVFYDIWLKNMDTPESFLFISYEAMRGDPVKYLGEVLHFMGEKEVDEALLDAAIEFCSFENMKRMEQDKTFKARALQPRDSSDQNSFKVRRGVIGGFKDEMSAADIEFVDNAIGDFSFDQFGNR